jgi:3,4-dihydroxy-2-butanone 4-phosphate synthase
MRIRRIVQVLASSTVLTLAAGVSGPALAQSFEVPAPACQLTGSASKVLRRIKETESSVTLLKATSIFPCDVQSQFIEALGKEIESGKDQSELHSILDRALDKATTLEAACVKQNDLV